MREDSVRKFLRSDPELVKEVRLHDGQRFRVRTTEDYFLSRDHLVTHDADRCSILLPYGAIASIRALPRAGRTTTAS